MEDVLSKLEAAQEELQPQFVALRAATGAIRKAVSLAAADKADALPMHKALLKLEAAAQQVNSETLTTAVSAFAAATQTALDNLAYDFAKDLREAFAARGETVAGRPPTLTVDLLTFKIDMAARKGQWFYGKEALTKPISLSLTGIIRAYDRQAKRIANRQLDEGFVSELQEAWQNCVDKRKQRPFVSLPPRWNWVST